MHAAAIRFELYLPGSRSLKAKRSVLRHVTETARRRFRVSVSEVDHHDTWNRAAVGVAAVAPTEAHLRDILDEVERFVWAQPDLEVLTVERSWMEAEA